MVLKIRFHVLKHVVKYGILAGVGTSTLVLLHRNDYDLSSIGIMRLARAGICACRIFVDYKISLSGLLGDEYAAAKSAVHKRSAEKLLQLACTNGGVWIKVGQHIGALEYLLPVEYVTTLSVLHSNAPESSFKDMLRVIREELGEPSVLFSEFDQKPLGAASLAQVYRARLAQNGQEVAVKVQHRRVKAHSFVDTETMEVLVNVAALLFPEFKLLWLVEEMKRNLPKELDFIHEGLNADRLRRMFQATKYLKIPEIVWSLTTDRVLTMEYCVGGSITDLD